MLLEEHKEHLCKGGRELIQFIYLKIESLNYYIFTKEL